MCRSAEGFDDDGWCWLRARRETQDVAAPEGRVRPGPGTRGPRDEAPTSGGRALGPRLRRPQPLRRAGGVGQDIRDHGQLRHRPRARVCVRHRAGEGVPGQTRSVELDH